MRSFRSIPAILFSLSLICFTACGDNSPARANLSTPPANSNPTAENANSAKTSVEELGLLVNIPYEAEEVVWKENKESKSLLAVLRFEPADAAKVVADAEKFGPGHPIAISPEGWFPDELIAQSEMKGDNALNGQTYPANAFLHDGFSNGKLTRIAGTDYFVLEATAP